MAHLDWEMTTLELQGKSRRTGRIILSGIFSQLILRIITLELTSNTGAIFSARYDHMTSFVLPYFLISFSYLLTVLWHSCSSSGVGTRTKPAKLSACFSYHSISFRGSEHSHSINSFGSLNLTLSYNSSCRT